MDNSYYATIAWDQDAEVWYVADTNFPGLVAEAASERELMHKVRGLVPELYDLNRHLFDHPVPDAIKLRMQSSRLEMIRLAG